MRHILLLVVVLVSSCGKPAQPDLVMLVPQIISTEVIPSTDAVTFFASVNGPAHFTSCGFGTIKDGMIREFTAVMDPSRMDFSVTHDGLTPDTDYAFYAFIANGTSRIQTPARPFRTLKVEIPDPNPDPDPEPPSVVFSSVQAVPSVNSAVLLATLSETDDVVSAGFAVSSDGINFTDYPVSVSGNGISLTLEGLAPDSQYCFTAWVVQRSVRVNTEAVRFRTEKEVHVVHFFSLSAEPDMMSVVLSASVDVPAFVGYCGFGLSREGRAAAEYGAVMNDGTFSVKVENLLPGMNYTCYAFVSVDGERVTSDFFSFRTQEDTSVHFSDIVAQALCTSVSMRARLSRTEGIVSSGFGLARDGEDFTERNGTLLPDGRLSLDWDGLDPGSHYRFYAFAVNEGGRTVSEVLDFYTQEVLSGDVDFVRLEAEVNGSSASLKAVLSSVKGISEYGFGLSLNRYDFIEYNASLTANGFERIVGDISSGKTYYYYAFFTLNGEYRHSELFSFTAP